MPEACTLKVTAPPSSVTRDVGCCWMVGAWLFEAQSSEETARLSIAMTVALPLVRVNCQRIQISWPAARGRLANDWEKAVPPAVTEVTVVQVPEMTDPVPALKI